MKKLLAISALAISILAVCVSTSNASITLNKAEYFSGMTWPTLTRDSVIGNSGCAPGACDNDRWQEKQHLQDLGWCMSTDPGNYWASTVYDVTNRTDILWFYVTCKGWTIKVRFALNWNGEDYSDWRVSEIFP